MNADNYIKECGKSAKIVQGDEGLQVGEFHSCLLAALGVPYEAIPGRIRRRSLLRTKIFN